MPEEGSSWLSVSKLLSVSFAAARALSVSTFPLREDFGETRGFKGFRGFGTGFDKAVRELPDVDGLLVRLERSRGRLRAVEYTEEELQTAAEHGTEVR